MLKFSISNIKQKDEHDTNVLDIDLYSNYLKSVTFELI